jgi:hypothetical protein
MKFKYLISVLIIFTIFYSCKDATNEPVINPLEGLTKLKEGYAIGASAKVELWGKKNFFAGYNNLTVVLYDSLNLKVKITDAHIHFSPVVSVGIGTSATQQTSPAENPNEVPVNDVFPGAVSFIKASDSTDSWKLGIAVHNHKYDKEGEVIFDITVDNNAAASLVKTFTSTSADSTRFILSLIKPTIPKEGLNDIELLLNENESSLGWTTDDIYKVEINPEMLDMWYSSHSFISTKNIGNGHYTVSFDFSMKGEWKINVNIKQNGVLLSQNLYFTLNI